MPAYLTKSFFIWAGAAVLWVGAVAVAWHIYMPHSAPAPQTAAVALNLATSTRAVTAAHATSTTAIIKTKAPVVVPHTTVTSPVTLAEAKSALTAAQAKLTALEHAKVSVPAISTGNQNALSTAQAAVRSAARNAYIVANNAVNNTAAALFTNPASTNSQLIFSMANSQTSISLNSQMVKVSGLFPAWQKQVLASSFNTATNTPAIAAQASTNLNAVTSLLSNLFSALGQNNNLSASAAESAKTNVSNAELAVSNALSAVTAAEANEQAARATIAADAKQQTAAANTAHAAAVAAAQAAVAKAQSQVNSLTAPSSN